MPSHDPSSHPLPAHPDNDIREPVLAIVAMPTDLNPAGNVFGGWIMAQMDLAGSIIALRRVQRRVSTVGVNQMSFRAPLHKGDRVLLTGEIERLGNTSITVQVAVHAERFTPEGPTLVRNAASGQITYVALDAHGKPTPIGEAG